MTQLLLSNNLISLAALLLERGTPGANDKWSGQTENWIGQELQETGLHCVCLPVAGYEAGHCVRDDIQNCFDRTSVQIKHETKKPHMSSKTLLCVLRKQYEGNCAIARGLAV
jgi:hypothetical protein